MYGCTAFLSEGLSMIAIIIKMNLQYKIACIMVTGEDAIVGGVVAKELMDNLCNQTTSFYSIS